MTVRDLRVEPVTITSGITYFFLFLNWFFSLSVKKQTTLFSSKRFKTSHTQTKSGAVSFNLFFLQFVTVPDCEINPSASIFFFQIKRRNICKDKDL